MDHAVCFWARSKRQKGASALVVTALSPTWTRARSPAPLFPRSALAARSPLFADVFVYTCNQNHRICRTGFYASYINIKFQKIKTHVNTWDLHAHCICVG